MKRNYPLPDGGDLVQGDDKAMPDRGTSSGMNGDSYGADLGCEAKNRIVGIAGSTKSDPIDETDNDEGRSDGDEA